MKPYVVKQGDYLEKIAHALGFDAEQVWNDPKNAELKKQRDPNLLHPGDILYVPNRKRQWLPLKAGTDNLYIAKVPRTTIHLTFKHLNKPRANEPYVIDGMGEPVEGTTDGDGGLEVGVPVHVREIRITFPKDYVAYDVQLGDMDPIDEPSGVRKRLQHLGFYEVNPGGDLDGADRRGILAYQRARGLPETGTLDETTKASLVSDHGS